MWEEQAVIFSRQNAQIMRLAGLDAKKKRDAEGVFRFDGIKLFCEALQNGVEIDTVFLKQSRAAALEASAEKLYGIHHAFAEYRTILVEDGLFDRISEEKSPDGVICIAKYIDKIRKIATINYMAPDPSEKLLLLESVRDPANIGAIVRSAAALGADRLILSADCADPYQPKVIRASMGNLFRMRVDLVENLTDVIGVLRAGGRRVFAAALDREAQPLGSFRNLPGDCVLIGNEGHGLSPEALSACTGSVYIPMREGVESLNAAVAASLFLWEFFH